MEREESKRVVPVRDCRLCVRDDGKSLGLMGRIMRGMSGPAGSNVRRMTDGTGE